MDVGVLIGMSVDDAHALCLKEVLFKGAQCVTNIRVASYDGITRSRTKDVDRNRLNVYVMMGKISGYGPCI